MKRKTVLLINDKLYGGGAETVFRENIKILSIDDNINLYYASTDKCDEKRHYTFDDSRKGIFNPIKYVHNFKNQKIMKAILLETKPDIIHIHNFYSHITPSILKPIYEYKNSNDRVKVIQTLHDYSLICHNFTLYNYSKNEPCLLCVGSKYKTAILKERCHSRSFILGLLRFLRTNNALNIHKHTDLIDLFICPSNFLREILLSEGIKEEKTLVLPNPISGKEDSIRLMKSSELFDKKKNIILYVGRLAYEKGVHELILVWKNINQICKDWKLIIIGEGKMQSYLQTLARNAYNVEFWGGLERDKVLETMKEAKVLVLPSLWFENQPTVVIEAILNGVVPVVRDIGGMKELAEKYKIIRSFKNIEELSDIIKTICVRGLEVKNTDFLNYINQIDSVESYLSKIKEVYFS
ncbi:MAG: glycosyltransferase family 4 protein [Thermodesulfovibrio sp.]|nr:glycosyltransferase family 4 protein [Thermodesulfovibrio sp.]